uniref:Uncharacterized protein n=1 Tax=Ascaris lumbricoides TaxID=6252 RepID=A0A9J2P3P3_ASCLU
MSLASRNRVWELSEQTGYLINSGVRQRPTVNSLKGKTNASHRNSFMEDESRFFMVHRGGVVFPGAVYRF